MLKRLSLALVAVSFTGSVVACIDGSSEEASTTDNRLTEDEKKACNFGFDEVMAPLGAGPAVGFVEEKGLAHGVPFSFGDVTGDGKVDLVAVTGKSELTTYKGKGDGTFEAGVKTTLPIGASEHDKALDAVAVGDFDGDGKKDIALVLSVIMGLPTIHTEGRYFVAYGKDDGVLEPVRQTRIPDLVEGQRTRHASWFGVADLDDDGKDDLVYAGTGAEGVAFGEEQRVLARGRTKITSTDARLVSFVTKKGAKPASLVIATEKGTSTVTFAQDRAATVETSAIAIPKGNLTPTPADLDRDERPELAVFDNRRLTILPLGKNAPRPTVFADFEGRGIGMLELANDQKRQLVFATDARKLFAACGYSAKTREIVATPLPIDYAGKTFVADEPDLDGDGKPDFVTYTVADVPADGKLRVYLGGTPPSPAPALQTFQAIAEPAEDAGTRLDAGPVEVDASGLDAGPVEVDSGTTPVVDAGPVIVDSGTTPVVDAGPVIVDSGTTHPVDSGTTPHPVDSGTGHTDAGHADAGKDGGTGTTEPGDGEHEGPKDEGTKPPTKKPSEGETSSSSGSITVTVTKKDPPPPADEGGCSASGARAPHAPVGSTAFAGLVGAVMFLARRRTRRQG